MNCLLLMIASAVLCTRLSASDNLKYPNGRRFCICKDSMQLWHQSFADNVPEIKDFITGVTDSPLRNYNLSGFIFGPDSPHMNEYPARLDRKYTYITGFEGYDGHAILLRNKAAFWIDGRHFDLAEKRINCDWSLFKLGDPGVPTLAEWTDSAIGKEEVRNIGIDKSLVTEETFTSIKNSFAALPNPLVIVPLAGKLNPFDVYISTTPVTIFTRPVRPIDALDIKFAGVTWQEKLTNVRSKMRKRGADVFFSAALDEIAWLYNLRGLEDAYNPFFYSYTIVTPVSAELYILDKVKRLTAEPTDSETEVKLYEHLGTNTSGSCEKAKISTCVSVEDYDIQGVADTLSRFKGKKVWVSPETNYEITSAVKDNSIVDMSPIAIDKTVKNPQERIGMRNANIRDSAAVIRFLAFVENKIKSGEKYYWEDSATSLLWRYRRQVQYNRGNSFEPASAYGNNGSILYYREDIRRRVALSNDSFFISDSGGDYLDGTTEVTRTMLYGEPTDYQRECYTRVLMSSINLAMAKWPEGLLGSNLDSLTRLALWEAGLDYEHVPIHVVGGSLDHYEGLGTVAHRRRPRTELPLKAYQYYTNEVGYYEDGQFGIRLTNVVGIVPYSSKQTTPGQNFLQFDTITLVPFETNLINVTLMTKGQVDWLNEYNSNITKYVLPLLSEDNLAIDWLKARTKTILAFKATGKLNVEVEL